MSLFGDWLKDPMQLKPSEADARYTPLLEEILTLPDVQNSVTLHQFIAVLGEMYAKESRGESIAREEAEMLTLAPAVRAELDAAREPGRPQ